MKISRKITNIDKSVKAVAATKSPNFTAHAVVIGDKTYNLCFDFGKLCDAEDAINREGFRISLLFCLDIALLTLQNTRILFAAAVRTFHPELKFADAIKLVDVDSIYVIAEALFTGIQEARGAKTPSAAMQASAVGGDAIEG